MIVKNIKIALLLVLLLSISKLSAQYLKPGDGIKISFLNIDDPVNGNYYILDNGKIQLPYLGLIQTQNKDFAKLKTELIDAYSKLYRNPELDIQALYRIDILGEVGKPGVYYLTGYESVTDLISLAGGETSDSNLENILIMRNDSKLEIDLESFLEGNNNINDIGIESGDKIFVPRTWWVRARDVSVVVSGLTVLVAVASLFTK